jgi:hypothetical protein
LNKFENKLKSLLWGSEDYHLNDKVKKRLFKYVGVDMLEEQSFDFEDNLFLLFFKLASLENYRQINEPESAVIWNDVMSKMELIALKKNGTAYREVPVHQELYYGEKARNPESELVNRPSMTSIKTLVEKYQGDWILFLEGEKKEPEKLISSIKERVVSAYVPTYERMLQAGDLIEFSKEMLDMSIELAVCAYGANKEGEANLAWSSLSKAKEYIGLYVGARIKAEKNLTYVARKKGPFIKKRNNQFVKDCLTKKIIQLDQDGWRARWNDIPDIEANLVYELVPVAKSVWDGWGKEFLVNDDELYIKIGNWLKTDEDMKVAYNHYMESLKADETKPLNSSDGYVCINESWLENFKNSVAYTASITLSGLASIILAG